jgi:tuftelin-interacting protein 11
MPIHAWLHPWTPFIGKQMESLFPTIRHKLGVALTDWHPSDASAHAILVPWRGVFDSATMENLLSRSILPKLILCLRGMCPSDHPPMCSHGLTVCLNQKIGLVINPLQQQLDPFNCVMLWSDIIAPNNFVPLLEMEFFPKWFAVLSSWLGSSAPNFEEISQWYSAWKQLFPASLQSHPRMQAQFNHALEIMNYHVQRIMGGGVTDQPPPLAPRPSPAAAPPARPSTAAPLPQQLPKTPSMKEPTMKEVVARWAEDNDLLFMPQNRTNEGKQVYMFGKLPVYMDKDLIYAPPASGSSSKWLPTSFDELVTRGR